MQDDTWCGGARRVNVNLFQDDTGGVHITISPHHHITTSLNLPRRQAKLLLKTFTKITRAAKAHHKADLCGSTYFCFQ